MRWRSVQEQIINIDNINVGIKNLWSIIYFVLHYFVMFVLLLLPVKVESYQVNNFYLSTYNFYIAYTLTS